MSASMASTATYGAPIKKYAQTTPSKNVQNSFYFFSFLKSKT
jgi:hypothetical protein